MTPVAMQQIPNTHQWTNWEKVFFMQPMQQLCGTTVEEWLEAVFSLWSVQRCDKQDKSGVEVVGRQSPASKGLYTAAEKAMALESITRQQPVKIQHTEKT
jgi:hypothetical protein